MRQGIEPPDIAVLLRGDAGTTALFAQVLAGYGIPVSHDRRVPLARTRLGAGVLAGARAALPGGTADGPAHLAADAGPARRPRAAPTRSRCACAAASCAARARRARSGSRAWAARRSPRSTRSPRRPRRAPRRCCARSRRRPTRSGPRRTGAAPTVLASEDEADARVASDLRAAAGELRGLAAADADLLGGPHDMLEALGAVAVREPSSIAGAARTGRRRRAPSPATPPAGVLLADPLAIRARRFRAVFVCGLQDGEFPRRPVPEPFLSDEDRRGLMAAAGLRLPLHEDVLDRERSLFYAAVSRPEDVLFLSWRSSDEEGEPLAPSAFLDDVRALFTDELWDERGTRLLADVTWAPRDAPTPHELRRAYAAAADAARAGAARRAGHGRGAGAARRARDRAGARARVVRRLRRALAGRAAPAARPHRARSRADAARLARARGARAHARAAARAHRLRADRAGAARRRARRAARRARGACARGQRRAPAPRAGARCCAGWRPTSSATCARRPSAAPATSRPSSSGPSAAPTTRTARSRWAAAAGCVTGRVDRVDVGPGGDGDRARLQGPHRRRRRQVGRRAAAPGRALPARGARAARPRAGRRALPAARGPQAGARAGSSATTSRARYTRTDLVDARRLRRRARGRARARRAHRRRPARRAHPALPGALLEPRLPLPGDLPRRRAAVRRRRRDVHDAESSARRSPIAAARRCSPPAPGRARPR